MTPQQKRAATAAVRKARALIARVKQERLNLDSWGEEAGCGTIACAAGHLVRARAFGLEPPEGDLTELLPIVGGTLHTYYVLIGTRAMAAAMALPLDLSCALFMSRGSSRYDFGPRGGEFRWSDHALFLHRCDRALQELEEGEFDDRQVVPMPGRSR